MHPEQAPLDGERQPPARLLHKPRHLPRARLLGRNLSWRIGGHKALGRRLLTFGILFMGSRQTKSFKRDLRGTFPFTLHVFQLRKSNIQLLITEEKVKK